MPVTAKLRYLRIAPRKVRLVADLIRGKTVEEAQHILSFTNKAAAPALLKLLEQAVANAKNNLQIEEKTLYISKILVDEGPKYKRWMPRARGQASPIQKKTCHVTIVLDELVGARPKKASISRTGTKKKKSEEIKIVSKTKVKEEGKTEQPEKGKKVEKPKLKPEVEAPKPKTGKGVRRIFRRKAF